MAADAGAAKGKGKGGGEPEPAEDGGAVPVVSLGAGKASSMVDLGDVLVGDDVEQPLDLVNESEVRAAQPSSPVRALCAGVVPGLDFKNLLEF